MFRLDIDKTRIFLFSENILALQMQLTCLQAFCNYAKEAKRTTNSVYLSVYKFLTWSLWMPKGPLDRIQRVLEFDE